jgi:hypothetical protein
MISFRPPELVGKHDRHTNADNFGNNVKLFFYLETTKPAIRSDRCSDDGSIITPVHVIAPGLQDGTKMFSKCQFGIGPSLQLKISLNHLPHIFRRRGSGYHNRLLFPIGQNYSGTMLESGAVVDQPPATGFNSYLICPLMV